MAVSVLRHVGCARDRAGGASTLSVEEDQEDQCTHEGKTTNHADHDTGDGAATQLAAASCCNIGRGRILGTCLAGGGNSDRLDLAGRGGLLDNIPCRSSRVGCGGLERYVSKFEPTRYLFGWCPNNTVCVEVVDVPVDDEVLLVLSCATNENKISWNSKAPNRKHARRSRTRTTMQRAPTGMPTGHSCIGTVSTYRSRSSGGRATTPRCAGHRVTSDLHIGKDTLGGATTAVIWITGAASRALRSALARGRGRGHVGAPTILSLEDTESIVGASLLASSIGLIGVGN